MFERVGGEEVLRRVVIPCSRGCVLRCSIADDLGIAVMYPYILICHVGTFWCALANKMG